MKDKEYWHKIWDLFRSGNMLAYEEIYNEFIDVLFAYGSKITKDRELLEDCIQDLFINIYKYGKKLDNPDHLEYYLFTALKRNIFLRLKKERRFKNISDDEFQNFNLNFDLEDEYIKNDSLDVQSKSLKKLLSTLDSSKRELLYLKFYTGLSNNEIAKVLNLKQETVKKQIYRLISSLRDDFGKKLMELLYISIRM